MCTYYLHHGMEVQQLEERLETLEKVLINFNIVKQWRLP